MKSKKEGVRRFTTTSKRTRIRATNLEQFDSCMGPWVGERCVAGKGGSWHFVVKR